MMRNDSISLHYLVSRNVHNERLLSSIVFKQRTEQLQTYSGDSNRLDRTVPVHLHLSPTRTKLRGYNDIENKEEAIEKKNRRDVPSPIHFHFRQAESWHNSLC